MRTARLLLQDILEAIQVIEQCRPPTLDAFQADPLVQSHVIRHIAIIGEAATHLPKDLRDANTSIPWRQIIAMRNIVVHVYHGINWNRVYETAKTDVPALKGPIDEILTGLPPDSSNAGAEGKT